MSHEHLLWIAVISYGLHVIEEHELNWRDWARIVLGLPVEWNTFYLTNAVVAVLGVCCASVGWKEPWFSLGFPALMIINATLFHVFPVIRTRVYSPGVATAIALFYPVGFWTYYGAWVDGVLSTASLLLSFLFGTGLLASPIVLIKIKHWKLFEYQRAK